jgi:FtsP/CotA-like multicopper oxidase with cupredoxin domain
LHVDLSVPRIIRHFFPDPTGEVEFLIRVLQHTQIATAADHSLRIAPLRLELAPGKVIQTFAYNDRVPGPVLRLREGRQVSIDIRNDTDIDDIIHWHGLYVPSAADGAMEEGSPMVERGGTRRYAFTAKPTGTRWYHSHDVAGRDLTRSLYAGLYGFLIVEPASDPGRYDQEVLLAAHHWEGSWVSMQDIRRGPPPDNGLELLYASASFNDKMLGHGEPVRVREGQRVLFRLLNASPTENVTLALAGHRLTVIALDGNSVPSPQTIDTLFLAPAERADVIVEMSRPGVWILGGVKDEDRKMGLGVVVEYANQRGEAQWVAPPTSAWDYTIFGRERPLPAPDERLDLVFEKVPGGRGGYNRWTINGKSWPAANPLFTTERGKRYRRNWRGIELIRSWPSGRCSRSATVTSRRRISNPRWMCVITSMYSMRIGASAGASCRRVRNAHCSHCGGSRPGAARALRVANSTK